MNERMNLLLKIGLIFFISFVETIILLGILFVLERTGLFSIYVTGVDGFWVYSNESGGFFFGLILTTNVLGAVIWHLVTEWIRKRNDTQCCDDITCIASGLPMCPNFSPV